MYGEKIEELLGDVENSKIHLAGGSVVGMINATINSLIIYISNLTIDKKKYENVKSQVEEILKEAHSLKKQSVQIIDKDKDVLEEILYAYKLRKEDEVNFQNILKKAVNFCMEVLEISYRTLNLTERISKVGNKMLESDFKICKYYSIASIMSSKENIEINLSQINDNDYKSQIEKKCCDIIDKIKLL